MPTTRAKMCLITCIHEKFGIVRIVIISLYLHTFKNVKFFYSKMPMVN